LCCVFFCVMGLLSFQDGFGFQGKTSLSPLGETEEGFVSK